MVGNTIYVSRTQTLWPLRFYQWPCEGTQWWQSEVWGSSVQPTLVTQQPHESYTVSPVLWACPRLVCEVAGVRSTEAVPEVGRSRGRKVKL